jgi:membrane associated rhomboid family serine protease
MERLLARLDRRFGRYAIPNLILYIVGGMALVWVLSLSKPAFIGRLSLDMGAVRQGEVWRLVTFLFIPPGSSPIWILINLYFTWWIGSSLEQHWGSFKFNLYFLVGALATIAAASIAGPMTNAWLDGIDGSLFLAFATTFPDVEILLFFILPIRVKWLGAIAAAAFVFFFASGDWNTRASIIASLSGYFLFFGDHWLAILRGRKVAARQRVRRAQMEAPAPTFGQRICAMCGVREADGADIRVCTCEKCGGKPRPLCLEHARNH